MGRHVDVDDLVTAQTIAARLGLAYHQTVYNWASRHEEFPTPVWAEGRWRLWLWSEVRAWAAATNRLPPGG
jgi:predicted DNA-binding transcriptional regulator AlpA